MKNLWRTVLSLTLALALCIGMSATAFGSESSSAEPSLDDILSLLSSLSTESEEEVQEELEEGLEDPAPVSGTSSMGPVSFSLPDGLDLFMDEDMMRMYAAPDFLTVFVMSLIEGEEEVDLTDEVNQQLFETMLADEGSEVTNMAIVSIDGFPALWIESVTDSSGVEAGSASIVISLGTDVYVGSVSALMDQYMDIFLPYVNSIRIEGAAGETDLSAAMEGSAGDTKTETGTAVSGLGSSLLQTVPAGTDADNPAEAIDASTGEEIVLLDDDLCKVSIKKFSIPDEEQWYGFVVKMFVENKSDTDLWVHADNVSLNGYIIDPYWGETVTAGHKSNSEMTFTKSELEANNITDIGELAFEIVVTEDETYDELESAWFTVLPFGADVPAQPEQEFGDNAIVLVDNDDFLMVVTGPEERTDYYVALPVYIENRTDINIDLSAYGSSALNGYEINPSLYASVPAGKKLNTQLSWSLSELEDNDIEEIEDVELDLTVQDSDDWFADPIFDEIVSFELN